MKITEEQKSKLEERLFEGMVLPTELFGDAIEIYDFEIDNYNYFLNNVKSLTDLIKGLENLSPLVDDALIIAKKMNEQDFVRFKKDLAYEREARKSYMPNNKTSKKYYSLIMPPNFIRATPVAEKFQAPLGATLLCIIKLENKPNINI